MLAGVVLSMIFTSARNLVAPIITHAAFDAFYFAGGAAFFGASTALLGSLIAGMATSEMGQTRKSGDAITTSALPPTADFPESVFDVRKVPCVDGSGLARAFIHGFAALVGAAMCSGPFDAVHMTLAIMPSADQVPVKSSHSTMRWH